MSQSQDHIPPSGVVVDNHPQISDPDKLWDLVMNEIFHHALHEIDWDSKMKLFAFYKIDESRESGSVEYSCYYRAYGKWNILYHVFNREAMRCSKKNILESLIDDIEEDCPTTKSYHLEGNVKEFVKSIGDIYACVPIVIEDVRVISNLRRYALTHNHN